MGGHPSSARCVVTSVGLLHRCEAAGIMEFPPDRCVPLAEEEESFQRFRLGFVLGHDGMPGPLTRTRDQSVKQLVKKKRC